MAADHPYLDLRAMSSLEGSLQALRSGEVGALVGNLVTTNHYIRELGISDVSVVGDTVYEIDLSFGVRRDWPELVSVLNKALAGLSAADTSLIYQRWIAS